MGKNYNTWGGKNNSWGNKNRKGGGNGPQRDDETWSKGAKVVLGGVVLLVLANTGLGPIVETAENVMEVFDLGNDVKEYKEASKVSESVRGSKNNKTGADRYKSVDCKVDLEATDVHQILEFFGNEFEASGVNLSKNKVNIVDYDVFESAKKYNKNVVNKLSKRSDVVTFMAVCPDYLTEEQMHLEFERIDKMITENKENLPDGVYWSIKKNGGLNVPNSGSFTMSVTFIAD